MRIGDQLWLSFHNLMLHKVRSILTSLGIIFGVGSVIAMLSISEGAKREALSQIEAMGVDKIIVSTRKPPPTGKDVSENTTNSNLETYGLTRQDYEHISKMDNVKSIATARNSRKSILRGTTQLDVSLFGVTLDFLEESRSEIVEGRWLSPVDRDRNVCVIGVDAKRALFSITKRNTLGNIVTVGDDAFTIVGVLENRRGTVIEGVGSPNTGIFISLIASESLYGKMAVQRVSGRTSIEIVDYDCFIVKVLDVSYIDYTAKRIAAYLSKMHNHVKDWEMVVPLDILKQREQTQNIFTIVMSSIAGISLLVGGIGIMNIMLANVYERRKEIGTSRALGAQKIDIIRQFLFETIFLTSIGGAIGVGIGLLIAKVVTRYANWPVAFSIWFILLALVISAVIGIIFGTYPAWKAAQQNPIDVLRAE
ncbi:MAG: Macrolide export ATP-binding/permease protein MacB [Lentisphaerae bacterium ADurb.Bin242]|nr:MAG: Macrolide export ATP-binding/permease protein MacB [Lentisphaerae bacterium ADurb.Bin242]